LSAWPTCFAACTARYQCSHIFGETPYWGAFYSFGSADDLRHNIVRVVDEKGQIVVSNTYGERPMAISFDKVVSQQLGPPASGNTLTFEYHDLEIEAGVRYTSTYGDNPKWPGPYSTPDPTIAHPWSTDAGPTWIGEDLCPSTCADDSCKVHSYLPPLVDPSIYAAQAVVIRDLHDISRIQYLGPNFDILREISSRTNRKLRDVAQTVIKEATA
jgi:hypothetical protein